MRKWGREHGPIDGIIGFSQGAAFASLLVSRSDPVLAGVQFVVLLSGFPPRDPRLMLPEHKIAVPALCIHGRTDFLKAESLQFAQHFSTTVLHCMLIVIPSYTGRISFSEHSGSHETPNKGNGAEALAALADFCSQFTAAE